MIYWRGDWGHLGMARQKLELAAEEAEELSRRARATTVSVRDRRQAEIIVLSARGLTQRAHRRAAGDLTRRGEPLGRALCAAPAGRVERSCRARAQAVAAAGGGAAGGGAGGGGAAPWGAMEWPHEAPRRRDLAGQRAAPVGGQRDQAASLAHLQTVQRQAL